MKIVKLILANENGDFLFTAEDAGKTCEFLVDEDGNYDPVALVYDDEHEEKTSV